MALLKCVKSDGRWIFNPSYQESLTADARLIIAGTEEGINMVEGSALEIFEQEFVDVLFLAHEYIKKLVAWQLKFNEEFNSAPKVEVADTYDWQGWQQKVNDYLTDERVRNVI